MGGVLRSVGNIIGYDSDSIAAAGNAQAEATKTTAAQQAQSNRDAAQAAQRAQETAIAQKSAADQAADLLNTPVKQADVTTAPVDNSIDDTTGKRVKARDSYANASSAGSGSGINI